MWIEAILTESDCARFIDTITPLTVDLGSSGRALVVSRPSHVEIVPTRGLRLTAAGHVSWTFGSLKLPLSIRVGSLLLAPTVEKRDGRDALCFRARVERLDMRALPDRIDATILHRINDALARHDEALVWPFCDALDRRFRLPRRVESADAVDVHARWGEVRITSSALVLAVSFDAHAAPIAHAAE